MSDVTDIDSIIKQMYTTISGPAGAERDWDRMRSFYYPGAHLVRTGTDDDGVPCALVMDVEAYIENVTPIFKKMDFYEVEIARRTESFGNIAHVFSSYEARSAPRDTEPIKCGINSIQLYNDGSRWWIINMLWDNEREGNPLPEKYEA